MWLMLTLVSPTWAGDCTGEETSPTELGSGTDADPWQLCTPAQLAAMRGPGLTGSELAGSYRLEADLDVADYDWGLGIGPCSLFEALAFTGDFDGAGHTISNLNTHAALWETGLFGCIRGGTVHDLYLDGVFIAAEQQAAGAVSVWAEDAVLSDVHVTNAEIVDSQWATGGLVGVVFESTLERVSYTGTVEGHENVGGLVGLATELVLQDTFAYGTVTGAKSVGGLVGHVDGYETTLLQRSHATVTITHSSSAHASKVGTVVGFVWGALAVGSEAGPDAVVALEDDDYDVIGTVIGELEGRPVAVDRGLLLDPDTYTRAGWDLETVWYPPTDRRVPTLR